MTLCRQIFDAGQRHYKIRQAEVEEFLATVEEGKKQNQEESIAAMEAFMDKKNAIFNEVRRWQDEYEGERINNEKYYEEVDRLSDKCNVLIHDTWKELMKLELQLFEQVEEVNQNFGHVLSE